MADEHKLTKEKKVDESHWIPISDLMSVLMMIFLFIAVSYMRHVQNEKSKIEEVAITYNKLQNDLYNDLYEEFKEDLEEWNASIDKKTLSVRFNSPDILFEQGQYKLRREFKKTLDDFFPRYVKRLSNEKYIKDIDEIRIEGHTSSEWKHNVSPEESYLGNMRLSQNRTREVLRYVLSDESIRKHYEWLKSHLTANGLSSSKLVVNKQGKEERELSRRVEFRVRTNAEMRIAKILELK